MKKAVIRGERQGGVEEVAQWVDQLPAGRERDQASYAIVDMMSFDAPQTAWSRALQITEPDLRQQALQVAFSGLAEVDPAAARAALGQGGLPPEDVQRLTPLLNDAPASLSPQPGDVTAP